MARIGKYVYEWPRPMVTVDAVAFQFHRGTVRVLLVQRGNEPCRDMWALPGGFIGQDEELDDAIARELEEETGLNNVPLQQMHTFGACGRDPRGRVISVVFMGVVPESGHKLRAGDDAAKARWFDINRLPDRLAFDHNEILSLAFSRFKRRKVYRLNTAGQ